MENKIIFNTSIRFPADIPLTFHVGEKESRLMYDNCELVSISNDAVEGMKEKYNGNEFTVYIKDEDGSVLKSDIFRYKLDKLFNKGTFIDVQKENTSMFLYFHGVPIGAMALDNELSQIFARRDRFKARIIDNNTFEIIRHADTHMHTEYSFMDSTITTSELAAATDYGCAITDHGNMHGAYEFYKEMTKRGKKPIIGCEIYVERLGFETVFEENPFDIEYARKHFKKDHMILLAKDNEGLHNLNILVSGGHLDMYKSPHVTLARLKKYSKGLIATSACISGTLSRYIRFKNNIDKIMDGISENVEKDELGLFIKSGILKKEDIVQEYAKGQFIVKEYTKEQLKELVLKRIEEEIELFIDTMIDIFGKDDFYLEIHRHGFEEEDKTMAEVLQIAKRRGLKITCASDSHYLKKEDALYHEIWECLRGKKAMNVPHTKFSGSGYHVYSNAEFIELFKDIPEALDNSLEILDKCNVTMGSGGKYYLPKFPLKKEDMQYGSDAENQKEFFLKKVREGFKNRFYGTTYFKDKEYLDRMQYEIGVIINMGFPSYFTIVQDFIAFSEDSDVFSHWRDYFPEVVTKRFEPLAKNENLSAESSYKMMHLDDVSSIEEMRELAQEVNDEDFTKFVEAATKEMKIQVGPGRGSAAGSLVAYCLGITKVDPIPYGLLFERFLSPDRISMPDIDVDIEDIHREKVIEYMRVKYGSDSVARISAMDTAGAKAIVRDVARVAITFDEELIKEGYAKRDEDGKLIILNESLFRKNEKTMRAAFGDKIAKTIPKKPKITLKEALKESVDFKELYDSDEKVKFVVDTAMRLEGLIKNLTLHACGVLVTDGPITDYMSKTMAEDKKQKSLVKQWAAQYQAPECEELGCLKIDFLGLRTLSMANDAIKPINQKINNDFYTSTTISSELSNFIKNEYPKVIQDIHNKVNIKKENHLVLDSSMKKVKEFLDAHKECDSVKTAVIVMMLQGVVNTPHAFIGKNIEKILDKEQSKEVLSFENIPTNDINVYKFISTGRTDGIFQIESSYMKTLMRDLYQDVDVNEKFDGNKGFERLCDANALGRPGPMREIPHYIDNMLHPEKITYEVPVMEKYLSATNGIITYQEQMMQLCRELAGFTGGQADTVRKGCAKKKVKILNEYGEYFIYGSKEKNIPGCINNGIDEEVAKSIWDKMLSFGEYAFNKSHSVAYSVNSSVTAWLSYYFPVEYLTSVLNSFLGSANRIKSYLTVAKYRGINILTPDINLSRPNFIADEKGIRIGLQGIRNVGVAAISIVKEREENGVFESITDFVKRMSKYKGVLNKEVFEALCYSGALDSFEGSRQDKLSIATDVASYISDMREMRRLGQLNFIDLLPEGDELKKIEIPISGKEIGKKEKLEKEYKYVGFYVTEHPLDIYTHALKNRNITPIGFLLKDETLDDTLDDTQLENDEDGLLIENKIENGSKIIIAGIIKDMEIKFRKKDGARFAAFNIEDQSGTIPAIIFTKGYNKFRDFIKDEEIAVFEGRYQENDYGVSIQVNTITSIAQFDKKANYRSVYLLSNKDIVKARKQFIAIRKLIERNPGQTNVIFHQDQNNFEVGKINIDLEVLDALYDIMEGENNVTVNHYS